MMKSIVDLFYALKQNNSSDQDRFTIMSLHGIKNHKLGISSGGYPLFFVQCASTNGLKVLDTDLEFITVQYNKECELLAKGKKTTKGIYTVILLKSDSIELQSYFLDIVYLLINKLRDIPTLSELKIELDKIVNLFSKFSKPATKTIQGLWAEVLTIENSNNPEYLIQSWHYTVNDRFDFNDGVDKIEVKSTAMSRRIHRFSLEQLAPNKSSKLVIVSLFVVETGKGKTLFDLVQMIAARISPQTLFKLNEVVTATLGKDFEKSFNVYFDYQYAVDSISYFDSTNIPSIDTALIGNEITNVKFDCDLTSVLPVQALDYESSLHGTLFS